jgi:peptide/nickel transport system substrate-binding protein
MKGIKTFAALFLVIAVLLAGCSVKTKTDVVGQNTPSSESSDSTAPADDTPVEIEVLGMSSSEDDLNIIRDQLTKNGFTVKLNIQPDYSTFKAQQDAGNFDLALSGWTTVTGNPDYAVRSLFKTGGDYSILSDPEIDELIEKASTETPEQYVETYKQFEEKLVFEKAYIIPLYNSIKLQAFNQEVLDKDSVRLSKSRSLPWEDLSFKDPSKNGTDILYLQSSQPTLTSLDPIKGNDSSINMINTNMYVRLVNLTDDDQVTSEGSLSYNHAIAEGNTEYYFILRDDVTFAKVENRTAVNSGERVGADDVIYSLYRAKDKNSVPNHRTYTLHEHIDKVEVVTDLSELEGKKVSGSNTSIREALEKGLKTGIQELVADKNEADNAAGKYQVVKLTTTTAFPQVLNYLAHQSAGIVSSKQVSAINTYDVANYDPNKDVAYGDQSTVTEGPTYNNTLYASGPYILLYKNDYEAVFAKNPGYMPGTEHEPKISNITIRFIKDADSALSALRSGEIHLFYGVPENKLDIVNNDSKLALQSLRSNAVSYLLVNTDPGRDVAKSVDLRKALLYSINQDEILAFYGGNKYKAVSTLTPLVDTGLELAADPAKVKEHLAAYKAGK